METFAAFRDCVAQAPAEKFFSFFVVDFVFEAGGFTEWR